MTDVAAAAEPPAVETTPNPPPEAGSSSQERDYEAEAAEAGWQPREKWTGKPEYWRDAKAFVEYGENINRVSKLEKLVQDRVGKLEKVHSNTVEQLQRQHAKEIDSLKAQKTAAVKAGNVDAVERIDAAIDELKQSEPEKKRSPEEVTQIIDKWTAERPWWSNKLARAFAKDHSTEIGEADPKMTLEENLRLTEDEVRKTFPDLFGGKKGANGHAPVDGGGSTPAGSGRSDPINALPNEARAQCKADMAKYPKMYPTTESWIKAYNS